MSDRQNKENKRKGVVHTMISQDVKEQSDPGTKENGETAEKGNYKQKSYYLTEELFNAVNLKAALTGMDKSAIVREALTLYLADILENADLIEKLRSKV